MMQLLSWHLLGTLTVQVTGTRKAADSLPKFAVWLDLSNAETAALALYFVLASLPIILSGIFGGLFSCALLAGTTAEVALALAVLPATRTSLWVTVFGMSFDRAIRFHKFLAWYAVACMWTHFLLYLVKSGTCIVSSNEKSSQIATAGVALFTFLSLMSLNFFRRRYFEAFRLSHWLFVPAFFLIILHTSGILLYIGAPFAIYAYDRLRRFMRSRTQWTIASTQAVGSVVILQARVPAEGFTYEAGQFCFIRVPSVSRFEWHPFSLTSCPSASPGAEGATISFAVKAMGPGSWSHKLLQAASADPLAQQLTSLHVDGPFGSLSHDISRYRQVLLVAGGIGSTPLQVIPILQQCCLGAPGVCERVVLVWIVRCVEDLKWSTAALTSAAGCKHIKVSLQLYVTGNTVLEAGKDFPIPIHRGRPNIDAIMKDFVRPADPVIIVNNPVRPSVIQVYPSVTSARPLVCAPSGKLTSLVLASGPEALVSHAHILAMREGLDFHQESFLF